MISKAEPSPASFPSPESSLCSSSKFGGQELTALYVYGEILRETGKINHAHNTNNPLFSNLHLSSFVMLIAEWPTFVYLPSPSIPQVGKKEVDLQVLLHGHWSQFLIWRFKQFSIKPTTSHPHPEAKTLILYHIQVDLTLAYRFAENWFSEMITD